VMECCHEIPEEQQKEYLKEYIDFQKCDINMRISPNGNHESVKIGICSDPETSMVKKDFLPVYNGLVHFFMYTTMNFFFTLAIMLGAITFIAIDKEKKRDDIKKKNLEEQQANTPSFLEDIFVCDLDPLRMAAVYA